MPSLSPRRGLLLAAPFVVYACPAFAQPAPDARPLGGTVVAGSAAIARAPALTSINQSSQRAAINWQSFDVGANQGVAFHQPSPTAMTLNRVTGPDPSQIAGHITANGQVVLVNPAGVVFYKGAQVNTNGLMVTAAGISNQNFMAGRMVFDQPGQPNAKVVNQGTITIRQAGLAALVAPQVANSGVITARLGHVVLAGAQTATLDMYGDGLVSIDVTKQVQQAPIGADGKPVTVLVTNTGDIRADGGTVQLTARAADGIVQNLVDAGGHIQANTVGRRSGTIVLAGVGGSISISGQLSAQGRTAGAIGGQIEADSNAGVLVQPTARINASGSAGGGVIALGTTLARARSGPSGSATLTAQRTLIGSGASITADATLSGNGGRVAVLSDDATAMAGSISARGGPGGGNGGFVEVSSNNALSFTGMANVSAPAGVLGTILFDPLDLAISDFAPPGYPPLPITDPNPSAPNITAGGYPDAYTNSWIAPSTLESLSGNIEVRTTQDLTVQSALQIGNASTIQSLTLQAGRDLTVDAVLTDGPPAPTIVASGGVVLQAGRNLTVNAVGAYTAPVPTIVASGDVVLQAGTSDPTGALYLDGGVVSELGSVFLTAPSEVGVFSPVVANATGRNQGITGKLISIRSDAIIFDGGTMDDAGGTVEVAPFTSGLNIVVGGDASGELDLQPLPVVTASGFATPSLRLGATTDPVSGNLSTTAGNIAINGSLYANIQTAGSSSASGLNGANLELDAAGSVTQSVPVQSVGTVSGHATNLGLTDTANTIAGLGSFTAGNALAMNDSAALTISGPLTANTVLIASTGTMTLGGNITAPTTELAVIADSTGAAQFTQTGSVSVGGGSTPTMTLVLPVSGGGSANFAGLNAPQVQLTLELGNGTANGTLQLGGLLVVGQNGSATLAGSIAGITTKAAAALGQIVPAVDPHYTFNDCTIGLAACGAVPTPTPTPAPSPTPTPTPTLQPSGTPTQVTLLPPMTGGLSTYLPGAVLPLAPALLPVQLTFLGGVPPEFGQLAGPDVVLPNISFRDY